MKGITFKDIAHFYLGCQVLVMDLDGQMFADHLESVFIDKHEKKFSIYTFGNAPFENHEEYYQKISLCLRRLETMTSRERGNLLSVLNESQMYSDCEFSINDDGFLTLRNNGKYLNTWSLTPVSFLWLTKHYFDVFNLIERGEATEEY